MIRRDYFKDRAAVIVESGKLIATFLQDDGAKLVSLKERDTEKELLVTKPDENYKVLTYDGTYIESECSGFDDMFPTVDPYTPSEGPFKGITYPDHGETCRIPYNAEISNGKLILSADSHRFPISYKKCVSASDDGGIDIEYEISNNGDYPFPFLWAGHIMLKGEDDMKITPPFADDIPVEAMFCTPGYTFESLPLDRLSGYQPKDGAAYKFYYIAEIPTGHFEITYSNGKSLIFEYDEKKLPYLGIWLNNGEFQDGYSITPEPCTVPFDSPEKAHDRGYNSVIEAKEKFMFTIHLTIKEESI
ncbi:MAG: hypothetical protein E7672_05890 [Ruminococcaceae bacterium]|nr:hypothetical protein [Oscillospiraceae bacterium]